MGASSRKIGISMLVAVTVLIAVGACFVPRFGQPQWYHDFADKRSLLGIPNFGDVASNLPFALVGLAGIFWIFTDRGRRAFLDGRERWIYLVVFAGLVLTCIGSSYYHLAPDNARLVWDRIPMTIVFLAMVASVIAERISVRAGILLLPFLLAAGILSVALWYRSELAGAGDLRFYAGIQVYAALILLIALLLPPKYTRTSDLAGVVGFYVLAKVLETFDKPILHALRFVSGHTLKHLAGAAAGYWILRMVQKREPISPSHSRAAAAH